MAFKRVLDIVEQVNSISIRNLGMELDLSVTPVWRILRKKLHHFPYKAKTVVPLTQEPKEARMELCQWLLDKDVKF